MFFLLIFNLKEKFVNSVGRVVILLSRIICDICITTDSNSKAKSLNQFLFTANDPCIFKMKVANFKLRSRQNKLKMTVMTGHSSMFFFFFFLEQRTYLL